LLTAEITKLQNNKNKIGIILCTIETVIMKNISIDKDKLKLFIFYIGLENTKHTNFICNWRILNTLPTNILQIQLKCFIFNKNSKLYLQHNIILIKR